MLLSVINAVGFAFSFIVNVIAIVPLFGFKSVSKVSDEHKSVLTPHPYTFLIWILIYMLQLMFIVYSLVVYTSFVDTIGYWFFVASLLNGLWLIAWCNERLPLSNVIIILYLACVMNIYFLIDVHYFTTFDFVTTLIFFVPFSVHFAWLVVATVLNLLSLLFYETTNKIDETSRMESEEWLGFSLVILLTVVSLFLLQYKNDFIFFLVIIIAIIGIYFGNRERSKITTAIIISGIISFVFIIQMVIYKIIQ
jgi:hypothetical protein